MANDVISAPSGASGNDQAPRTIGPAEGIVVAFRSAVEVLGTNIISSVALGIVISWLAIRGLDRERRSADEPARSA